jgi:hypothetical protein
MQTTTQDKLNEIIPSFDKANNAENQSNLIWFVKILFTYI